MSDLGIEVPAEFGAGVEGKDRYMDYLAGRPWSGYSGRAVEEKAGHERAHSYDVLSRAVMDQEIVFFILGNEQPTSSSRELCETMKREAREINQDPKARTKVIFKNAFDFYEQTLLLTALDMEM